MSVQDQFPTAPAIAVPFTILIQILAAVVLVMALAVPALNAPTPPDGALDWHGNSASVATNN